MCLGCNRNHGREAKAVTDGLRGPPPEAERITNLNSFLPTNSFRVCSQGQYFSSEDVYLEEEKLSDHHEPERRAKLLSFAVTGRRWKLPEGAELRQGLVLPRVLKCQTSSNNVTSFKHFHSDLFFCFHTLCFYYYIYYYYYYYIL